MCSSVDSMLRFLVKGDAGAAVAITPTDRDGMWLQSTTGLTGDTLKSTIEAQILTHAWQITSVKGTRVLIEPADQTRFDPQWPYMFHVSDRENLAGILSDGLVPKAGGNTTMNRTYDPPRVFFAVDLLAAFEFVEFQCANKKRAMKNIPDQLLNKMIKTPKERDALDIWRVELPGGIQLFRDVLFPGRAVWTLDSIPRRNVSLVKAWQLRERLCRCIRNRGLL